MTVLAQYVANYDEPLLVVPALDEEPWPTLGPQVCDFIEAYLVHGPGDLRGQPVRLDDEKRALIYRAYEIYPQDHPTLAGRRRFKRVGISLRKGSAKTEWAAMLCECELDPDGPVRCHGWDGRGEPIGGPVTDPYIPMVAYTEEQSEELAYGALLAIVRDSPRARYFDAGEERIKRLSGEGKAVALASAPDGRDGARTTFQHFDETHRFNTPKLRAAHRTMLANIPKRMLSDAWSLETTTAPAPGEDSIAERTMDYARSIHEGKRAAADLFYFHRQASMHHDISTPKGISDAVLEASGPALAAWSDLRSIEAQFNDPTADIPYLRRVWLNQLVRATSRAFDVRIWNQRKRDDYAVEPRAHIALGFDGAQREDSTALIGTEISTGYQFVLGIWEKPTGRMSDEEVGAWSVPEDEVNAAVELAFKTYQVWRMYADPYYWETWVSTWAGKYGDERVVRWPTVRFRKMADAVRAFDNAMKDAGQVGENAAAAELLAGDELLAPPDDPLSNVVAAAEAMAGDALPPAPAAPRRDLSHSGDPVLARHIANAFKMLTTYRDERGERLWVIQKERPGSPNKIDAAVAAVLSWQARLDALAKGIGRTVNQSYRVKWVG